MDSESRTDSERTHGSQEVRRGKGLQEAPVHLELNCNAGETHIDQVIPRPSYTHVRHSDVNVARPGESCGNGIMNLVDNMNHISRIGNEGLTCGRNGLYPYRVSESERLLTINT